VDDEIAKGEAKLANPNFADKAPAAVVEEHRQRLADFRSKRAQWQQMLDGLGA
jgi:valyl-tRNA synthetase